jgi:hypothetical protein
VTVGISHVLALLEQATTIPESDDGVDASDYHECRALIVDEPHQPPRRRRFGRQIEFPANS